MELARGVYWVAEQMATLDLADMENQALVRSVSISCKRPNVQAIRDWRGLGSEPWHYRVHDAMKGTETTVAEIVQCVADRYLY